MPISALGLALASAFVHATWNLLIARERDTHAVTAAAILYALAVRRRLRPALRTRAPLAGVGMIGAYALTLAALRLAAPAPVAAVRETSVVIGVALGALFLHERVGAARYAGAVAIAAGIAAIAGG